MCVCNERVCVCGEFERACVCGERVCVCGQRPAGRHHASERSGETVTWMLTHGEDGAEMYEPHAVRLTADQVKTLRATGHVLAPFGG